MSNKYVGFGKKLFDLAKGSGDKSKVATTIVGVAPKIGSLKERRKNFESLVKGADKHTKNLTNEGKIKVKKTIQPAAKKISNIMNEKDKIKKATGGRVGRKLGGGMDMSRRKTAVEKIKETFATKSKSKNKNLKPVDKKKNPGLAKLPIEVRNKMGYAKKGGRA